ncbi:MAG: sarcosine oxidase subunit alpha family protein [Gammaproteobacteria bacterium]|nr:sarcosine oxidase subunit alpha family protein [Gammaproteobacteria bacterium]
MSETNRLPSGGRIDRSRSVTFKFNGEILTGYAGDTVASALLANNIHLVARSFKYHRPRGIMGSGPEEPCAMLQVGWGANAVPNGKATQVEIYEGLEVSSVNAWPSVKFDVSAVNEIFSAIIPAGFYYKTFMYPQKWWMFYEKWIRKAAGFGVAESETDPDRYEKVNAWCDVLVVGGGPAGLSTALSAAKAGARVVLVDEKGEFGGGLLRCRDESRRNWLVRTLAQLAELPNCKLLRRTTAVGYYDANFLVLNERLTDHLSASVAGQSRERLWRTRAKQVVLATGAIERPIVFGNNDLPGVMLCSAVSEYIHRFAVKPGSRSVVFTNNDSAYQTALDMIMAGIQLIAVVDVRRDVSNEWIDELRSQGVELKFGFAVKSAKGRARVRGVKAQALSVDGSYLTGSQITFNCNLLAVSGGWSPAVHLHAQSGGKPVFDPVNACFVPGVSSQNEESVGAANADFLYEKAVEDGARIGAAAAARSGFGDVEASNEEQAIEDSAQNSLAIQPFWRVPSSDSFQKQFVDFQNDTTAKDIALAAREGYRSIEHLKRYTLLGFGTDQGKLGNINGMAILSQELNQDLAETGTTTFRPLYTPVTFGAIAGREVGPEFFDTVRKTAMHSWHVVHNALFENVGQWKRPWYYPQAGESMTETVNRECMAVRKQIGMLDASTLGKIEIFGPDSTEFLNYMYTNAWNKLETGRCRYGLMLGENGMVMDDGVTSKLGDNHYYMTTTTGGAAHVLNWMEQWRQTEWPHMKVYFTSVTDQWAVASVSGPKARHLLEKVTAGISLSDTEFPFMSFKEGTVCGVPARIFRISFSGELSYEINVEANYGLHVWSEMFEAGREFGITPYGTETMHVLRAEKGFIIVGQDTDGSITPDDLGMNWIVSKKKDFLGKRSLSRSDCVRPDRKQFVGLLTEDPDVVLPEGAQLVDEPSNSYPVPMIGHVTSSYWSATLGRSIALAVVKGGHSRLGAKIYSTLMSGESIPVTISNPVFYDAEGERQHV